MRAHIEAPAHWGERQHLARRLRDLGYTVTAWTGVAGWRLVITGPGPAAGRPPSSAPAARRAPG